MILPSDEICLLERNVEISVLFRNRNIKPLFETVSAGDLETTHKQIYFPNGSVTFFQCAQQLPAFPFPQSKKQNSKKQLCLLNTVVFSSRKVYVQDGQIGAA